MTAMTYLHPMPATMGTTHPFQMDMPESVQNEGMAVRHKSVRQPAE